MVEVVKGDMTGIVGIPLKPLVVSGHAHVCMYVCVSVHACMCVREEVTVGNLSLWGKFNFNAILRLT